jgi:hypothetical protein
VGNQQLVVVQTAYDEFLRIIQASGGSAEQKRAERFLLKVAVISDDPSPAARMLKPTRRIGSSDIIILGTGDRMGMVTMTADAKAVRAASAQGVDFGVYLHSPYSLTGS